MELPPVGINNKQNMSRRCFHQGPIQLGIRRHSIRNRLSQHLSSEKYYSSVDGCLISTEQNRKPQRKQTTYREIDSKKDACSAHGKRNQFPTRIEKEFFQTDLLTERLNHFRIFLLQNLLNQLILSSKFGTGPTSLFIQAQD